MQIIDGKALAQKTYDEISSGIQSEIQRAVLNGNPKKSPRLDIILVGDDFASVKYVSMKENIARKTGIEGITHHLPENTTTEEVVNLVKTLNDNSEVDGFMVQLPMPQNIDENKVLDAISTTKDADGLNSTNLGMIFHGDKNAIMPATAAGILEMLDAYNVQCESKNVVIIGTSAFIGIPLSGALLNRGATVTMCHKKTLNIEEVTAKADILISATGCAKLVKANWIKEGAVVIDVGISSDPETGKLVGDIDFDAVSPKCSLITPVPGGVGPMTIASLMKNVYEIWKRK